MVSTVILGTQSRLETFSLMKSAFTSFASFSFASCRFVAVLAAAALPCMPAFVHAAGNQPASEAPKNVIFLIGDGMGLAQVSGAMASGSEPLALERAEVIGLIRTSAANAYVTDSAAAGTALSSGQKTNNGIIGQNVDGEAIPSLLAYAVQDGKSAGIVVTSTVTHATPASFFGHNASRKDEPGLAEDLFDASLDVIIGGGRRFFEKRADERMLTNQFRAGGYTIAYTMEEVLSAPQGRPLLGLLADNALPRSTEGRGPVLAQATAKALELLGSNPQGFVLMVEGSQIDWGSHQNNWEYVLSETLDFDATVKIAMDYADANPNTLVIVTADHETGGLSLVGGNLDEHKVTTHWGTKGHSATLVPVYAYGADAAAFSGIYENTDIFQRILKVLGLEDAPAPAVKNREPLPQVPGLTAPSVQGQ